MKKTKYKIIISIIILSIILFGYALYAKNKRLWPFGSSLGYLIPNNAKTFIYGLLESKNKEIQTFFYNLKLSYYQIPENNFLTTGGAIKQIDKEKIFYVNENGEIYIFDLIEKKFFKNKDKFNEFNNVRDIEINKKDNELYMVAIKEYEQNCGSINLIKYHYELINNSFKFFNNETIWESEKNCPFRSKISGSRVLKIEDNFYVSTGIFMGPIFSGIRPENFSQKIESSFGKIIKINKEKEATIFATGFRNPQGLFNIPNTNIIFGTDHGPNGGDELNLIEKFNNYGWPCISYGKLYKKFSNKYNEGREFPHIKKIDEDIIYPTIKELEDYCDQNKEYTDPIYTLSKGTIGISQGVYYDKTHLKLFKDNLIVSSLSGKSLFRFVLDKNKSKVISSEQIYIGNRIRDIELLEDGRLFALSDNGFLINIENSNKEMSDFIPK